MFNLLLYYLEMRQEKERWKRKRKEGSLGAVSGYLLFLPMPVLTICTDKKGVLPFPQGVECYIGFCRPEVIM